MNCGACGHGNGDSAKFCEECGSPMAGQCSSCSHELDATAKFCPECGTPTSSPPAKEVQIGVVSDKTSAVVRDRSSTSAVGRASMPMAAGVEPDPGTGHNLASEQVARAIEMLHVGDLESVAEVVADEVAYRSHRRIGTGQATQLDRGEYLSTMTEFVAAFRHISLSDVVVRGERLALVRAEASEDGFAIEILVLVEVDEDGRLCAHSSFDPSNVDDAHRELDHRFSAEANGPEPSRPHGEDG